MAKYDPNKPTWLSASLGLTIKNPEPTPGLCTHQSLTLAKTSSVPLAIVMYRAATVIFDMAVNNINMSDADIQKELKTFKAMVNSLTITINPKGG